MSGMPPTLVATTGVPHPSASWTTFGHPSRELARQKTSAADMYSAMAAGFNVPQKWVDLSSPQSWTA